MRRVLKATGMSIPNGTIGPNRRRIFLGGALVAMLAVSLLASGCLYVTGDRSVSGWQQPPRNLVDDWRRLDMSELMAYSDAWFVVDAKQRGVIRGYASGASVTAADGGYFELAIVARQYSVPVQQTVRVYFDENTLVYEGDAVAGTILRGVNRQGSYDITIGGRILEVPFHVNGGRLFAERVILTSATQPQVP